MHHLRCDVDGVAALGGDAPPLSQLLGEVCEHRSELDDSIPVKRRLLQSTPAKPQIAIGGEQATSGDVAEQSVLKGAFVVAALLRHEDMLHGVGVREQ